MPEPNAFDPERDQELGRLLRAHFDLSDSAEFVARVVREARVQSRESLWEILAGWARPGIAAAVAAMAIGLWFGLATTRESAPLGERETPAGLIVVEPVLDRDLMLASVLE